MSDKIELILINFKYLYGIVFMEDLEFNYIIYQFFNILLFESILKINKKLLYILN